MQINVIQKCAGGTWSGIHLRSFELPPTTSTPKIFLEKEGMVLFTKVACVMAP